MKSNNADMFGGEKSPAVPEKIEETKSATKWQSSDKILDKAARLRQEAAELEVALREEARAKGLPEEMINKLVPLRASKPASSSASTAQATAASSAVVVEERKKKASNDIRSKLGYLNTGDAVRMTSELDRIKSKGDIHLWHSSDIGVKPSFQVSNVQFTTKTQIEPVKLKLDDVGFEYQKVLGVAIILGSVLGLSASQVGGQLGFFLGYGSALIPIALVGLGSIAPSLIGEIINNVKYAIDEKARDQYVHMNAGKFLVGYVLGLPVSRFVKGSPSNLVDFFQIRPVGRSENEDKKMFAKKNFKQIDIARCSASCVAGNVAECIIFGQSNGSNPGDINLLFELINTVEPALTPEQAQGHVRWSGLKAYEILKAHQPEYKRLVEAFRAGLPLEECIAAIEGTD
jgi:hypothetical protein